MTAGLRLKLATALYGDVERRAEMSPLEEVGAHEQLDAIIAIVNDAIAAEFNRIVVPHLNADCGQDDPTMGDCLEAIAADWEVLKNKLYPPPPAPPAPKWVPQVEDRVRVRVDTNPEFIDRVGTVAYIYTDETGQKILGVCFRGYADYPIRFTLDVVHPVDGDEKV